MNESVHKIVVIRKGKRTRKSKLSNAEKNAGYKVSQDGKKVKMSAIERLKRKKAARASARKSKNKRRTANIKRLNSIRRRPMGRI